MPAVQGQLLNTRQVFRNLLLEKYKELGPYSDFVHSMEILDRLPESPIAVRGAVTLTTPLSALLRAVQHHLGDPAYRTNVQECPFED